MRRVSRVYETVGRPFICPSVPSSGRCDVGPAAKRYRSIAARLAAKCKLYYAIS